MIAQGVIPAATKKIEKPAVVSTDSESEHEVLEAKVKPEDRKTFKWTEFYETTLEELLEKHMFDFDAASLELS